MQRIPIEKANFPKYDDNDVIEAWKWFISHITEGNWNKRKAEIEKKILIEFRSTKPFSEPLTEGTLLVIKDDVIGWYLYLIDVLINEPYKYEFYQGARIVPIFKRLGMDLDKLRNISGIETRVKDLLKKRPSEADSLLFEMLVALLWVKNGYEVSFLEEKQHKTPDIIAKKDNNIWHIECKRQTKTSNYAYKETSKRQKLISFINEILIEKNILLDIVFHVELETLPDTYLFDLLKGKLELCIPGKIISNEKVDIDLDFVDIEAINNHLEKSLVQNNSPMLQRLIGKKPLDNKAFSSGMQASFVRLGDGEINNLYVNSIKSAYGVFCYCDAKEALIAKARDIKNQIYSAMEQFDPNIKAILHVGMETFDGPEVERERLEKIKNTIEKINPNNTSLRWIFCHFFQAYSPPDQNWIFDETVSVMSAYFSQSPPLKSWHLVIPEDEVVNNLSHWERPLPL